MVNPVLGGLVRASRRYLTRHPWNLMLAIAGIGLGSAVVIAVDLTNASARTAFRLSMEMLSGTATHQIAGGPRGVDETVYATLRLRPGSPPSAPVVSGAVTLGERNYTLMGIDPLGSGAFRGDLEGMGDGVVERLLVTPGAIMVSASRAAALELEEGDDVVLEVAGGTATATIAGTFRSANPAARDGLLVADIATAQELLGRVGRLDRIDLILEPGMEQAMADTLPAGLRLTPAAARTEAGARMTEAFHINLAAMSLLALLVGAFIIYNAMTFAVLSRRPLFGQLRVIGVTRGELFRLILGEALILGLVGTLIGVVSGMAIAQGLIGLVTRTINDLYFSLTVNQLLVSPTVLAKGVLVGLGATLLSALLPAREAARSEPVQVQRRSVVETPMTGITRRLAVAGLGLLVLAAALLAVAPRALVPAFGALFMAVIGFSLLVPGLLVAGGRLLGPVMGVLYPPLGTMALRGITRSLSRTAPAIAALTVAVAGTVGVGIMIESFRGTVELWLAQTLTSDIYVSAPESTDSRIAGRLDPGLMAGLETLPGVDGISRGRRVTVESEHGPVEILALAMRDPGDRGFRFKGAVVNDLWAGLEDGDLVLVSEPYAWRHGVAAGERLELFTATGWRSWRVGGVFYDYGSDRGLVVMHQPAYAAAWEDDAISALGLTLAPGATLDAVMARVEGLVAATAPGVRVRANRDLRAYSMEVFDRTFAITRVLRLLAVGVAVIGIIGALLALHLERSREYGTLRAIGATPRQMGGLILLQSALMGLLAGVLALPLGLLMALMLIKVVYLRAFGWTMQTLIGIPLLAEAVALALGAALVAALYPAWRIARTPPALTLREE
ncbi:MAG: ABC transporter permease [Gammaproteobacteria bacterium]|nr:ABC transporter permease [Gammaproteobacteria bacterium]